MKHLFSFIVSFITLGQLCVSAQLSDKNTPPNVIIIITDDAGYHDFGFQGSNTFKTPHIDAFAQSGMVFRQAYVTAAVCGPSRAGILTGRYQQRFGYEENNVPGIMSTSSKLLGDEMGLPTHLPTIANHMKMLGYKNSFIGKWHLGNADKYHPLKRGFDHFVGFRGGARSFYPFGKENPVRRLEDRIEFDFKNYREPDEYLTHFFANQAVEFIAKNKAEPFFLMLSFNAVHTPLQADPKERENYPNLSGKRKTLAQMTSSLDKAFGKLIKALEDQQIRDNTLVIFTNDNGGPTDTNSADNYPLNGTKANHLEGGIRVPFVMSWPEKIPINSYYSFPISTLDILPTVFTAAGGNILSLEVADGVDLIPYILRNKRERPHEYLFWKKENRAAVRHKNWKFLRFPDRPAELYDLSDDISEKQNLATKHPELVKALYRKLFAWELEMERPLWQLERRFEGKAMERMDAYRKY